MKLLEPLFEEFIFEMQRWLEVIPDFSLNKSSNNNDSIGIKEKAKWESLLSTVGSTVGSAGGGIGGAIGGAALIASSTTGRGGCKCESWISNRFSRRCL